MIKKVHRSKSVKILTFIFMTILVVADIYLITQMATQKIPFILCALLFAIISATIFFSYMYAPMCIRLTDSSLILHRGIGKKVIDYSDIREIDIYKSEGIIVRVCGIGGVFGFIGKFYNKKIGHYFSYVGDYSQTFYVQQKNGKKYVFSCEDREYIVFIVKKKVKFSN